jgi:hypothetical protein
MALHTSMKHRDGDSFRQKSFESLSQVSSADADFEKDMIFPTMIWPQGGSSKFTAVVQLRKLSSSYDLNDPPLKDSEDEALVYQHAPFGPEARRMAEMGNIIGECAEETETNDDICERVEQQATTCHPITGSLKAQLVYEMGAEKIFQNQHTPHKENEHKEKPLHDEIIGPKGAALGAHSVGDESIMVYDLSTGEAHAHKDKEPSPRAKYNKYIGNMLDDQARRMRCCLADPATGQWCPLARASSDARQNGKTLFWIKNTPVRSSSA